MDFRSMRSLILTLLLTSAAVAEATESISLDEASRIQRDPAPQLDPIAERTAGMVSQDGFIPVHYDEASGRLFLEVTRLDEDFLYAHALATGLGSIRPRLDRGTIYYEGSEALVRFERHGPRIMLVKRNTGYRAQTDNEALRRTVEESFPTSVLAAFTIDTQSDDGFLVDATELFLTDIFGVRGDLRAAGLGETQVDRERSYILAEKTKAFPKNTEIRAVLTFATDEPAELLRTMAPDGRTFALQQHHSFVELPDPGFQTRQLDPRVGSRHIDFWDFAQGFDGEYRDRLIWRWRLEKAEPAAEISDPVEPIVFYMEPGIPEPYRTAFREGGMWWNEAFEAAGFRNAFEIRDLPEGVDPMDARYNVILWVHLAGQQPSTAPSYKDPRTGEIIKAIVRMESHRSLHSYNFYAGMRPAMRGDPTDVDAEEFAMSARRWHAAHELGHALGFEHNFIAGAMDNASIMDYRPAWIGLDSEGRLDLSQALRDGLGAHDTLLVRYTYTQFDSPEAESAGLEEIVNDALVGGHRLLTGRDAGPAGSVPGAHRWVSGTDMLESLERGIAVRRLLLENFNEEAVEIGEPMSFLAERLAHIYVHHRFPLDAATKFLGGLDYTYTVRGDGQIPTTFFSPDEQKRALDLVLSALAPEALAVPERVSAMIPPPPFGFDSPNRYVEFATGVSFDPLSLARGLAADIVDNLLHRERAARMISFRARNPENIGLGEVLSELVAVTWEAPGRSGSMEAALLRISQRAVLDGIFRLAADEAAAAEARAAARYHLAAIDERLRNIEDGSAEDRAHRELARGEIERFLTTGAAPPLRTGVFSIDPYYHWP